MSEELALVSSDDLINELLNRYDHAVFGAFEDLPDGKTCYISRWKGNSGTAAGLCTKIMDSIWVDHRGTAYSEKSKEGE